MHNAYIMETKVKKMSLYLPVFITSAWTFHPEISFCLAVDGLCWQVSSWVTQLLITQPTHEDRKAILSCIVRLAFYCWCIGNFNTTMEIVAGLKSVPTYRKLYFVELAVQQLGLFQYTLSGRDGIPLIFSLSNYKRKYIKPNTTPKSSVLWDLPTHNKWCSPPPRSF